MQKNCRLTNQPFEITDDDLEFYEKMKVPPPTLCPVERSRQRLAFRNVRNLHKRKCDATGKPLLSMFSLDVPFPVYDRDYWFSDEWDSLDCGQDFDFSRPFFEQFKELYKKAPAPYQSAFGVENCDYCNGLANCRNCYLSFNMDYCESCYYLTDGRRCNYCVDNLGLVDCELCYECINCSRCYNLRYSLRAVSCSDSYFLYDCRNCKNCIGCTNLTHKEYYIFNKKVSKEDFEAKKRGLQSYDGIRQFAKEFHEFQLKYPKKYYYGHSNEGFSGDDVRHLKNSYNCFYSDELENCKYCNFVFNSNNCQDYDIFGDHSSWIYNCLATGLNCTQNAFCMHTWASSSNNFYCNLLVGSKNCFGCCSLRHKEYCILNKQYTKDEYEEMVPRIITHMKKMGEWGEFFPAEMSVFGYNQTLAHEYYPLSKEEVLKRGWKWKESKEEIQDINVEGIDASGLPMVIDEVTDDILGQPIICEVSGRPFLIQKAELDYYRKMKIPLPRRHWEVRHLDRMKIKNPYLLFHRVCDREGCNVEFESTFALDRPEKVYCEKSYLEILE